MDERQPDWDPAPQDDLWTGRAEVRPSAFDQNSDRYEVDEEVEGEPAGHWWMPIVVGTVGLLLLALLGYGIYVIALHARKPAPTTTVAPAAVTTVPATSATPTTAPTTTAVSVPPTPVETTVVTTEPATTEVAVPALRGMPLADAKIALQRSGLGYRVIGRPSDAEPGTVIDSDPPEGRVVPPDTAITLVVAAGRTGGPAPTTPNGG
ncbi:hypothetical protein ACWT_0039 [Actinoplanes sp. SE50]|uniref:PASTA domain-containing protein n=1 Tax=unclassified Actinoplanes TaxID=2626549 RepID=UPI00023ECF83|nr:MULTISPECIES: PASTA domain-containing protein [unclassified Actinoplanes]AEV81053.1 hypothetical protein ACPL_154 [Actinoplanes sp. SE50/110]ATO79454.1 hypothetical protein ACWT_0039 [Actinoplanes sp. SE50]SLL96854.1 hypothetical protein ACSP50_0041 [Actinoplanes sp. SE50/110]